MNRVVRRRLETAVRVRDFSRAHPSTDASYAAVLGQLERHITRMETLSQQQQHGYLLRRSATTRRRGLRRTLQQELLPHLVTVAEMAAKEAPTLVRRFRLPPTGATYEAFRTLARQMLEQGQAERDLLVRHGLAESLLGDLAATLERFDASMAESNTARGAHVGARAELKAVSKEVMQLIELLNGLNRYRFPEGSELRAAWESARNMLSGPKSAGTGGGKVATPAA